MVRYATGAGDVGLQLDALFWLITTASRVGDFAETQQAIGELEGLASRTRVPMHQRFVPLLRAEEARRFGRFQESETMARQHLELATKAGVGEAGIMFITQFGATLWFQGRLHEVVQAVAREVEASPTNITNRLALAAAYAEHGDQEEAVRVLTALPEPTSYPRDSLYLSALGMAAIACSLLRDSQLASQLRPLIEKYPKLMCELNGVALIHCTTGAAALVATVLELWDEAEQKFVEAIEQLEQVEFPVLLARVRWEFAEMLARRNAPGDRDRAITIAQQAHAFAKEVGMAFVERRSAELLASLT
jgi:hypothetical protein